tara:strand:- start:7716 stop:9266 length:1551 start_codon:yes stop_codon:yes gene_type:complete
MSQKLQPLTVAAPGFLGINTEESPVGQNAGFSSIADNCVIDKRGRIGARKGYDKVSTNGADVLGTSRGIEGVFEFTSFGGTVTLFSAGNNKIFHGTSTLAEVTLPTGYSISANNWKITSFNNDVYFFQTGHAPLRSAGGSTTLVEISGAPQANEVLSAFGRLWAADLASDKHTIHVSQLLDGTAWSTGDAFQIDVTQFWPEGYDEIVSLTEHNGLFIVFGNHSMLLYDGAQGGAGAGSSGAPSTAGTTIFLKDTVEGVGCIERDSVQATGNDILFLSNRGVMSLGRLIQEKSLPLRDVSKNVRTDLMEMSNFESLPVKSVYSAEDAFYLLTFPSSNTTYCFDVRQPMEDGSFRVTTWSGLVPLSFNELASDGFYIGLSTGVVKYEGYLDDDATYQMSYFSNELDFGNPSIIKFLKKFHITVIGGNDATSTLNWAYDYSDSFSKQQFKFESSGVTAEYNVSEFNTTAEFTGGVDIQTPKVNTTGSGSVVKIGVVSTINNFSFAIQKIDILAKIGRLV